MTERRSRRRWRLHARTRLTLWYTLLLAGTFLVLGGGGILAVERTLYASLDESLRARALAFEAAVEHEWHEGERGSPGEIEAQAYGLDVFRAWDGRGRLIFGREEGTPSRASYPGIPDGDVVATERLVSGTTVRLVTHPIRVSGRIGGVVQVGRSTADLQRVLATLRLIGLVGLGLALCLAGLGGSFLARRALAPVDRVTRAAELIGAEDLSRRLDLDLPDDEMGRLAGAFDAMIARLEAAFERQRRFTADASHEIRTPLGIMRSQVDVALARPRSPEEYIRVLEAVRVQVDRLSQLTERLLTLARADGPETVTLVPVDLQDIAAEAAASVAGQARARGVRFDVEIEDVPAVQGDPIWLGQLLLNLLDNALRHTPPGGRVTLSLEPAATGEGHHAGGVVVRVEDTGEGIAPEHLPHLFERFYRVDPGRARTSGGAGLGLAICDWVARIHGGRLTVTSAPGAGSSFTLWLPASQAPLASRPTYMPVSVA